MISRTEYGPKARHRRQARRVRTLREADLGISLDELAAWPADEGDWVYLVGPRPWSAAGMTTVAGRCAVCGGAADLAEYCLACDAAGPDATGFEWPGYPPGYALDADYVPDAPAPAYTPGKLKGGKAR